MAEHDSEVPPGTEIWVVLNEDDSPIFCAGWPEICHEYINDAINKYDLDGAGKWKVRRAEVINDG